MTEIRHIVFDIGKVLIHYDPNIPFSRLIPDEKERKWFFDNVCTHDWNIEQDRGRTWEEAEALLIAEHPDHAENIRNFRRHWHDMVPHAYDDSVAIMVGLIESGHDVVSIHLAGGISGTCEAARQAHALLSERGLGERVEVLDSESGCGGTGLLALAACAASRAGADRDAVIAHVRETRKSLRIWFCLDTLEYLRRGGRIGKAQARRPATEDR